MAKKSIEELYLSESGLPKFDLLVYRLNPRRLAIPIKPSVVRCRFDILEKVKAVAKDAKQATQIMDLIESEFPDLIVDYRVVVVD